MASDIVGDPRAARTRDTPHQLLQERDAVCNALLAATSSLAQGNDAETIMRRACDALVLASRHIRLAWMFIGDANTALIRPVYAIGPARAYAEQLRIGRSRMENNGPTRTALRTGQQIVVNIRSDPSFEPWRDLARHNGLEQCAYFPMSSRASNMRGVIAVYADQPGYFQRIGLEPFSAFAHLGEVSLETAALHKRLRNLATFDALTGALNRAALTEIIGREHARATRSQRPYSLILFDIDRFKLINDHFGHQVGDQALAHIAALAQNTLREGDWLGRWGGEEFLCMLPETDEHEAMQVAERLRNNIVNSVLQTDGREIRDISVSIGVSCYPNNGDSPDALLTLCDAVLYEAKRSGRNRVIVAINGAHHTVSIAAQIERALLANQIRPAYQPIVMLSDGHIVAEEALARIATPEGQWLPAEGFIEAASQLQLVHRIDYQMMRLTLIRCMQHISQGRRIDHFVNVSADLLRHPELIADLLSLIYEQCAACGDLVGESKPLVIEITEREFLGDTRQARNILAPFLDLGLKLAIDDFGSGYSSFQYLADLPVAFIKIEGDLVRRASSETRVRNILRGIRDTARDLDLTTLAECVEDGATEDVLREVGIDLAQGYYYGRPVVSELAVAV